MTRPLRIPIVILLVCVYSVVSSRPAEAQAVSGAQAIGILAIIAGVGAAIGIGVYYAVRQPPSITGCITSGARGMSLQNEGNHQDFLLMGDIATIKPGDRVRLKGKKKKDSGGNRSFLVDQMKKNYGACPVSNP